MFDDAWEHSWESLKEALHGVDEAEAAHVPADYDGEDREEGWPAPGSILWQVAHLGHCKAYYTALIAKRGSTPGNPDAEALVPRDSFVEHLRALQEIHANQRAAIAGLTQEDMELKVGNGMLLPEFLSMIIRHDIWHASQVAVARRAWRRFHR
ncbi:MAG: DinB family protein [Planctomycetota bacterium]|nr:DinB family protein [Sulfitobacter sp.]MDF1839120.1 DinB family protein [Planctomycetota bacterium]